VYAGLISVGVTGDDERLEVVGDGVDIACLVKCLRRKICYAEILQVEIVKDKPPEEPKKKPEQQQVVLHPLPQSCSGYCSCYRCYPQPMMMVCEDPSPNLCAVM
jgi:hypothetical protein